MKNYLCNKLSVLWFILCKNITWHYQLLFLKRYEARKQIIFRQKDIFFANSCNWLRLIVRASLRVIGHGLIISLEQWTRRGFNRIKMAALRWRQVSCPHNKAFWRQLSKIPILEISRKMTSIYFLPTFLAGWKGHFASFSYLFLIVSYHLPA